MPSTLTTRVGSNTVDPSPPRERAREACVKAEGVNAIPTLLSRPGFTSSSNSKRVSEINSGGVDLKKCTILLNDA